MRTLLISVLLFATINSTIGQTASATYQRVKEGKVKGKIGSYIAKNGRLYIVGDTLYLGEPSAGGKYAFVNQNPGMDVARIKNSVGSIVVIKKMRIMLGGYLWVTATKVPGYTFGTLITPFEMAIESGEINSGEMSSDQALKELKKTKEKLDRELITKKEYDAIRAEIGPLISSIIEETKNGYIIEIDTVEEILKVKEVRSGYETLITKQEKVKVYIMGGTTLSGPWEIIDENTISVKKIIVPISVIESIRGNIAVATYQEVKEKKVKGEIESYIAKNGRIYSIGDTLYLGSPSNCGETGIGVVMNTFSGCYTHVYLVSGDWYPLSNAEGGTVVIKEMNARGEKLSVLATKAPNYKRPISFYNGSYVIKFSKGSTGISPFESALSCGEVSGGVITTEQAIKELKKAKEKLDLGLITEEEYNAIRAELDPIIM